MQKAVQPEEGQIYTELYWPPDKALHAGRCDEKSREVLFVAVLRALGVPARLNPAHGTPEFWQAGKFVPVVPCAAATLLLQKQPEERFVYMQNWSLASLEGDAWKPVALEEEWNGDSLVLELPAGQYRMLTSTRLPNGNQFVAMREVALPPGGSQTVPMHLREYCLGDMLSRRRMPDFYAEHKNGEFVENPVAGTGRCALLYWLEEGAEPTEHVLNELMAAREELMAKPLDICFFVRNAEALEQPTLAQALEDLPGIQVFTGEWDYNLETLARYFTCDPERPPLSIVCDQQGYAVFADSGYNVGSVEMALGIVEHLLLNEN